MKNSTKVTGLKAALPQLKKSGGEVPQDGVDLVGGDQREEVGRAVQRQEATQSLAGDEEAGCRGRRDVNLSVNCDKPFSASWGRNEGMTNPFAACRPRFQTGVG